MFNVACDKTRIRPLVRALWQRKIQHLSSMPPVIRWLFHWRWASHTEVRAAAARATPRCVTPRCLATLARGGSP